MPHSGRPAPGEQETGAELPLDYAALVDLAPIGLAVLDADLRYVVCNRALAELNGLSCEAHLGKTIHQVLPDIAAVVVPFYRDVLATGQAMSGVRISDPRASAGDPARHWLVNVQPIRNRRGDVTHILVSVQDITEHEAAQAALRESEAMLSASQKLSPDGFTILRAVRDAQGTVIDFIWDFANPAAHDLLAKESLVGRSLLQELPENRDHEALFPRYVRLVESCGADAVELEYRDGPLTGWFRNSAVAIDADRIAVSFTDITARKRAEERLHILSQEFRHRVKNLLAVIGSLVWQAGKAARDVPSLTDTLQRQLQAMAAAQNLFGQDLSGVVGLDALVEAAMGPFRGPGVRIAGGPPLLINADWGVPLALALHELATNAIKYGALSDATGHVTVGWRDESGRVILHWHELGGPPVSPPNAAGFGMRLLDVIRRSLPDGDITTDYLPSGLQAEIRFNRYPLARV